MDEKELAEQMERTAYENHRAQEYDRGAAQTVADALARRCADAVTAGDIETAERFADAQKCVHEVFPHVEL